MSLTECASRSPVAAHWQRRVRTIKSVPGLVGETNKWTVTLVIMRAVMHWEVASSLTVDWFSVRYPAHYDRTQAPYQNL